jgi:hypothetical protein
VTASLYRPYGKGALTPEMRPWTLNTNTLAIISRTARSALLEAMPARQLEEQRTLADRLGPLVVDELVPIFARVTDVLGGNLVLFDDGSGPIAVVMAPGDTARAISAMRAERDMSIIARAYTVDDETWARTRAVMGVDVADGAGVSLDCVLVIPGAHQLVDAGPAAQALLDRLTERAAAPVGDMRVCDTHGIAGCIECAVADPDDSLPGYREEVEWVTRRGGRSRREERARVRVTSEIEEGERVDVERLVHVVLERDPYRTYTPAWIAVDDPAERTALMAEGALRLYARQRRHEQPRPPAPESQSSLAKRAHEMVDRAAKARRP